MYDFKNNFLYEGIVTQKKEINKEKFQGVSIEVSTLGEKISFFSDFEKSSKINKNDTVQVTGTIASANYKVKLVVVEIKKLK